ncbi:BspA family leucine-rich repeat surface protein [Cyclobacterium xiamenense]|uniref:BspA family leucine-rich repeat surface protein n=1 Tax=Cyclobacterium xiamenense TaxID=1297121 RepID=UPI0012B94C6C|nr:BspA family leucine-rich repeat surface protein [Cyclobacterium xiamenense]
MVNQNWKSVFASLIIYLGLYVTPGLASADTATPSAVGDTDNFITVWDLSKQGNYTAELRFGTSNSGGSISYNWQELPTGASGSGTFEAGTNVLRKIQNLPANARIRLEIEPTHLERFYMRSGSFEEGLVDVEQWGTASWTQMRDAFFGCENLIITATDTPDLSRVTSLVEMFRDCKILNGPSNINEWNTSNVIDMSRMFEGAFTFNQDISNWDVGNVINMFTMFYEAHAFDQDISSWNTSNVTNMFFMFREATSFNQDISSWNTANVSSMAYMFLGAASFNQNLGSWTLNSGVNLSNMLDDSGLDCANYSATLIGWAENSPGVVDITLGANGLSYGTNAAAARTILTTDRGWSILGDTAGTEACELAPSLADTDYFVTIWDLSKEGISSDQIFFSTSNPTGPIAYSWQVLPDGETGTGTFEAGSDAPRTIQDLPANAKIRLEIAPTHLERFYFGSANGLVDVEQWGTASWTSMENAFNNSQNLDITATDMPDLSQVSSLSRMFSSCKILNGPATIKDWNTGNVTNMSSMFQGAEAFNQDISGWNTSNVTSMSSMFDGAVAFNQPIGSWNTANVTDMLGMFQGATAFSQDLSNWNTGNVIDMPNMFRRASAFNSDISNWNTGNVTSMSNMFRDATAFNQDISGWNTEKVESMSSLFRNAAAFNQDISSWNTANVTSMSNMFRDATAFNQDISGWNTEKVESMWRMFSGATAFNQDISSWNTANVSDMSSMFEGASAFNQNLGSWSLNSEVDLSNMLDDSGLDCANYSATLIGWAENNTDVVDKTLGANGLSYGTNAAAARTTLTTTRLWSILGDTAGTEACELAPSLADTDYFVTIWDLSKEGGSDGQIAFQTNNSSGSVNYRWEQLPSGETGSGSFDTGSGINGVRRSISDLPTEGKIRLEIEPTNLERFFFLTTSNTNSRLVQVTQWGTVSWSSMKNAFFGCDNLMITASDTPDLSGVTDMTRMFKNAKLLNGPSNINTWNTDNVSNMSSLFEGAEAFNQDIGNWNTLNVADMSYMFSGATAFNQDIGQWNTEKVYTMYEMFRGAAVFNQDISSWNVGNVEDMYRMFSGATSFNQGIGSWNTEKVTDMSSLFNGATSFNQDISSWSTANVTNMSRMFAGASAFNQNLGSWTLNPGVNLSNMLDDSGLDCTNYSATLIGWAENNTEVVDKTLGANGLSYGTNAAAARTTLTTTRIWSILGDTAGTEACELAPSLADTDYFVTIWDLSKQGIFADRIRFFTSNSAGSVSYSWQELPMGASGTGTFESGTEVERTISDLPSGKKIRLEIEPTHLERFYVGNNNEKSRLVDVEQWGTAAWTSMEEAFFGCENLEITASDLPDLARVTSLALMFSNCKLLNGPATIKDWNTSNVTDMNSMFSSATAFNQDIGSWNTVNVTNMAAMFNGAAAFNQDLSNWNTENVTNMSYMFQAATVFNGDIAAWNTANVTNMQQMFYRAAAFNQDLSDWNTSKVTNMAAMFGETGAFNQDISNWDVGNVTTMSTMFYQAYVFDQDISSWNTEKVADMSFMFNDATSFNQDISSWNTANVTTMWSMFEGATAFNQDISSWNTANVSDMSSMFEGASAFNQNLGSWSLNSEVDLSNMLDDSGLDCANYSATLIGWAENNTDVVDKTLGANGLSYGTNAAAARTTLTTTRIWSILGDTAGTEACGEQSFTTTAYCSGGSTFTDESGSFSDGSVEGNYLNNQSCSWLIEPSGTDNFIIELSFSAFELENCCDYVRIYDGTSDEAPLLGEFNGTDLPDAVRSTGRSMYVTFSTDGSIVYDGFAASYQKIPLPTVTTTAITTFDNESASLGGEFAGVEDALVTERGFVYSTTTNPTTEDGVLQAGSGIGSFSENLTGLTLNTTYYVKAYAIASGITVYGEEQSFTTTAYCSGGSTFTDESGSFSDGSVDGNYINNQSCSWLIEPTNTNPFNIELSFSEFELQTCCDYVRIYDGTSDEAPLLGEFNGTDLPDAVRSTGRSMYVTFSTDGSVVYDGFAASYELVPANISVLTVENIADQTYMGSALEPSVVVKDGETTLELDTDYTLSYENNTDVGIAMITITGSGNYTGEKEVTFNVIKAKVTITADNKQKTFGEDNPELTFTYSGLTNGDTKIETEPSITTTATAASAAGGYPITLTGGADDNYEIELVNGTLTVGKAKVTITADDKSKTYGEENPELTFTYDGLVNGDTKIDTEPSIATTATAASAAGDYPIELTGGADDNYEIELKNGTLTVGKAKVTITADDTGKTYGEENPELTFTFDGLVNGDTKIDTEPSITTTATAASAASDYPIELTGGADDNYDIELVNGTLKVGKAKVTITADNKSKIYGEDSPELTFIYTGLVNGDTQVATEPSIATTATAASAAGDYPIELTGGADDNYEIELKNGTLTVGKAKVTITADDKSKTYGEENPSLTFRYEGLVNGDTKVATEPSIATTATAASAAGDYPISLTGGADDNYEIELKNGTLTIGKANLTITADGKSKIYGEDNPELTFIYTGLVNGDTQVATEPSILTTATAASAAGDYPIELTGGADDNYEIELVNGTLTIGKAKLTITADNKQRAFGEDNPELTFTYSGLTNGDTKIETEPSITTTATAASAAGDYPITLTGGADDNYEIELVNGTLTVGKAKVTITADNKQRAFGEDNPELTFTYSGLTNGDTKIEVEPSITTTATAASAAGEYPITLTGGADDNYEIELVNGTLTVGKAKVTIAADNKSNTYGDENPELTFSYEGLVNGDTKVATEPSIATTATAASAAGEYPITLTGGADDNYEIELVNGTLTVGKAKVTITADNKSKTYGEENPSLTFRYEGLVNGDTQVATEPSIVTTATAASTAGDYPIELTGGADDNYEIELVNGTLTIGKAKLTITADDKSKIYGEENPSLTFTYDGLVNGDTKVATEPSIATTATAASAAGDYPIELTGGADDNYEIELKNGTLTVGKAKVRITADNKSKTYGEENPSLTFRYEGLVNGDTQVATEPSIATTATASSNVGIYAITLTGGEDQNYLITLAGAELEINPAVLQVKAENKIKIFGQDDPVLTYTVTGLVSEDEAPEILKGDLAREAGEVPGRYAIRQGTLTANANYLVSFSAGSLLIEAAKILVAAELGPIETAWGQEPALPSKVTVLTRDGQLFEVDVRWDTQAVNIFGRGTYSLRGTFDLPEGITNPDETIGSVAVNVAAKPGPLDVTLSNREFAGDETNFFINIGSFAIQDPIDPIHKVELFGPGYDNPYFEINENSLFWSSSARAEGKTVFTIIVRVTDRDGNTLDKFFEIIRTRPTVDSIDVYDAFTPNNDGPNDRWGVPGIRFFQGARVHVFDRSGTRVFYTEDPDVRWDGTYRGKELPTGAYTWVLEVPETGEKRMGILNLFRK